MKRLFFIYLFFVGINAFAQQGLQMDFTEQDSVQMKLQRQIEYFELISGVVFDTQLMDEKVELPGFDFMSDYRSRYTLTLGVVPTSNYFFGGIYPGIMSPIYSPFYNNASVLSSAAYQLGDKFVLGGYSYGTNSIFSGKAPNHGTNNFDSYGSTLYMQYKVSKNFKIETRVNVQQNGHHPGF